jgi:hypothetical protein
MLQNGFEDAVGGKRTLPWEGDSLEESILGGHED